jgi:hypothetical protein
LNWLAAVELVDVIVIDDGDVIDPVIVAVHLNVNDTLIMIATVIVHRSRD